MQGAALNPLGGRDEVLLVPPPPPPPGPSLTVSLIALALSVLCYGVGSLLQAMGARRPARRHRLVLHPLAVGGLALDVVGFAGGLVALTNLPLFLVYSASALSLPLTAGLALVFLRERATRGETTAIALISAGVLALSLAAHPGHSAPLPAPLAFGLFAGLPLAALASWACHRRSGWTASLGLALLAGGAYACSGLAARGLSTRPAVPLERITLPITVLAYALLGVALVTVAMRRLPVNTVTSVLFATDTAIPAAVGLLALGDRIAEGRTPFAVVGFTFLLLGTVQLSRRCPAPAVVPLPRVPVEAMTEPYGAAQFDRSCVSAAS